MSNKSIAVSEKEILAAIDSMCVESLCPDTFDKWEAVKAELESIRVGLSPEKPE